MFGLPKKESGKKIMVSGVKPTGRPHIGNYFGAMKQYVDMQDSHDSYVFIANYHAIIGVQDKDQLLKDTLDVAIDYLAIGLDSEKTTLYVQSDVPEVTELTWIFNTLVTVPFMQRAHAYKDAVAKYVKSRLETPPAGLSDKDMLQKIEEEALSNVSVGLFDYPVLMAADILLPGADVVAVGQDQKQHIEYARDIAQKFNNAYGETFKLPEHLIIENVAIVPGTDGQKMSKSYGNTIPLFATREEITKAVMSIVTNSDGGFPTNLFAIHKLFKPEGELKALYEANVGSFKVLKEALIEDIDAYVAPLRERREQIAKDPNKVLRILEAGAKKARAQAQEKMTEIREKVGIL